MRYWYDTEFIEDGKTIDLVSIGLVAEDGREYYAQLLDFNGNKASPWVCDHVLAQLLTCDAYKGMPRLHLPDLLAWEMSKMEHQFLQMQARLGNTIAPRCPNQTCPWRTRERLCSDLVAFLDPKQYGKPELWGYYADYDHVALCQLFGTMMDLPKGWPMYTRDIKQLCDALGNPRLPEQGKGEHNALADARWNKQAWEFLQVRS